MISDRLKKLIQDAERESAIREFWEEVERESEKYNVSIEYYLMEFY